MPALRPFQREDVEFIKKNNLKVLIASAPGTGKTGVAIRSLVESKATFPALVICPATVTRNWEKEVQKWAKGIRCVIIEDMDSRIRLKPGAPTLFIISWSLLDARLPDLYRMPIQSIVADECFPAGTLVSTAQGLVPIEDIRPDMQVWSKSFTTGTVELKTVTRLIVKPLTQKLLTVRHEQGEFRCTPNHKIWTEEKGYVEARLLRNETLCFVPDIIRRQSTCTAQATVLRQKLFSQVEDATTGDQRDHAGGCTQSRSYENRQITTRCESSNVDQQSNVVCRCSRQDGQLVERSRSESAWWQRDVDSGTDSDCTASGLGYRSGNSDGSGQGPIRENSNVVQSGCWESSIADGYRDRRGLAFDASSKGTRPEEGFGFVRSRVVSITCAKSGSCEQSTKSSGLDSVVYDLEVVDNHNYFAHGVLVSNCHYAKNMESQRSQAIFTLAKKTKHILLLSGTPIVNNKSELAVLHDLLGSEKPPMIRRLLEDVAPDIPPKTRSYLNIKLRPADQAEYNKANEEFEIWLKERKAKLLGEGAAQAEVDRILAAEALAKIGYLRRMLGDAKVPACSDFIARAVRMGEPVVCFVEHQTALERLSRALNKQRIRHEIIDGSTTPKKRQEIVERFQKYEFPVFIGTRAAKEGITLTAARHLIFLERFFTSADEEQAEDRVRRIGQTLPTTIWFLHALGTVDERVDQIVKQKRQVIRSAIGSATVEETPLLAVEEMIKNWQKHVDDTGVTFPGLGLGTILPPLPSPKETHAVTFSGKEWHLQKAMLWCKMNGYIPTGKTDLNGRFKLIMHPPQIFNKNKFKIFSVSKDIKIIHGERLSKANERRIRKQLRQLR